MLISPHKMPCYGSGGWLTVPVRAVPSSIPGQRMLDLWWTKWHWGQVSLRGFPCQYHSSNAPSSYLFACCCYRKGKIQMCGSLPKSSAISEIGMKCTTKYFHLVFLNVNIISAPYGVSSYRCVVRFLVPSYDEYDFSL